MDFRPTDDQRLLTAGVHDLLAGECTPDHVRAAWASGAPDPGRWKALVDLGVVGLLVPEAHGGMGLDDRDLVGLLVEAGRAALPEPVLEVAGVAAPLLAELGGDLADTWLPRVASGDATVVVALPDLDPYPAHVADADLVLVGRGEELWALTPAELEPVAQPTVDGARPTCSTRLPDAAPTVSGPDVAAALRRAGARGGAGAAAVLVGAGEAMIGQAVAHASTREQFGRPIGTFQAVKHHLATALVDVRFALPLVERAAHALATDDDAAPRHASMAKAFAAEAADAAARRALQVHGAIGYTWECDLHLWMKRVWSLGAAWGDAEHHWQVVERSVLA